MTCQSNGKPLCRNGVQQRFEAGRGIVTLPCPLCKPEEFAAWAEAWKAAPKPEPPEPKQVSMFEQKKEEYPE